MKQPVELLPSNITLKCTCGAWTWWRRPRQRGLGTCMDCAGPGPELNDEDLVERLMDIVDAFPGCEVITPDARPTMPGYAGAGAGPCASCRQTTRLYGPWGQPLCRLCEAALHPKRKEPS